MSGGFLLDWAIMAVSLFNMILLLWLGLTVLLNAERRPPGQSHSRRWGIWLASGGLFMGGAFFVSHSAILGYGLAYLGLGTDFWWHVGWLPVIALPFVWYVVILWYAGYWEDRPGPLYRWHRPWFLLTGLLAVGLVGLFVLANPLPAYWRLVQLDLSATPSLGGVPLLILVYPLYIVLCILLSLVALRRPGPSGRMMGDLARDRARPWLVATSVVLLVVSLLVAGVMIWIVSNARQQGLSGVYAGLGATLARTVAWFDLIISLLIGVSVVLLGQAIVAYEVFTGKTLPRRGLMRHWHRAVILAAGYGLVVGWSLVLHLRSIYSLLLTAVLMTLFYALLSWRSYADRERHIERLRPFVASPRLYERLLASSASSAPSAPDVEVMGLFEALCRDVLGASAAYLVPLGPLTPLVGSALAYPATDWGSPPPLAEIVEDLQAPDVTAVSLDPVRHGGALWAVPLRSERGLIGVLLLGAKGDGGLYAQEEIEIAQASGERLMDTLASAEIARRLLALERQRLAECQDFGELSRAVFDQRARRLLHDDVLPLLHTAMLGLGSGAGGGGASPGTVELLADAHRQISDLLREMPAGAEAAVVRLGLVGALRQVVGDELAGAFDEVVWQIEPEAERKAQELPGLTADVLFHAAREAMRNAARHGRSLEGEAPLRLCVRASGQGGLALVIEDDGVGLAGADVAAGGGQGLALHSTMMAILGGTLAVESLPGRLTRVSLALPDPPGS